MLGEADYQRQRWKNGAGWTTEIARGAAPGADGFRWRVSVAEIEDDCTFSVFSGFDRILLLLAGQGLELIIAGQPEPVILGEPHAQVRFAGEAEVQCRLLGGPTRDFNVMHQRGVVDADVEVRRLHEAADVVADTESLLHVVDGEITASAGSETATARENDTLHVDLRNDRSGTLNIAGDATLIMVKLTDVHATI